MINGYLINDKEFIVESQQVICMLMTLLKCL